jgi:nicotinate-nucleotide adenylyltransferase
MKKFGIFGGAFDPPHNAHLVAAERAREECGLDSVLFVPTSIPPHKQQPVESYDNRLELVKRAVKGNPYFEISDMEMRREGTSYTVDTLLEAKMLYPKAKLFLLIGMDEALDFMSWRKPETIMELADPVVFCRPGVRKDKLPKLITTNAHFIDMNLDISSTAIRQLVREGKSINKLVPERVSAYIKEKGLYSACPAYGKA